MCTNFLCCMEKYWKSQLKSWKTLMHINFSVVFRSKRSRQVCMSCSRLSRSEKLKSTVHEQVSLTWLCRLSWSSPGEIYTCLTRLVHVRRIQVCNYTCLVDTWALHLVDNCRAKDHRGNMPVTTFWGELIVSITVTVSRSASSTCILTISTY